MKKFTVVFGIDIEVEAETDQEAIDLARKELASVNTNDFMVDDVREEDEDDD